MLTLVGPLRVRLLCACGRQKSIAEEENCSAFRAEIAEQTCALIVAVGAPLVAAISSSARSRALSS
jgi:hypothetical protein